MDVPANLSTGLGGEALATALRSGIHGVILEQETLNRINVFPVADGDTGTNLSLSLGHALGVLDSVDTAHIGRMLATIADALLDGARGNSGAIVAQFFQGMSDAAERLGRFTLHSFADAVSRGSDYARDALTEPREGTILSVIHAFAASLRQQLARETAPDFATAFGTAAIASSRALAETQNQLDVLRKAGVVDAGAKGFVALIDGMAQCIVHGREVRQPAAARLIAASAVSETSGADSDLRFRYCTECVVTGGDIDRRKLREALAELGDSLVLAGTKRKARVHIHVNDPEAVFSVARRFGGIAAEKADDMHRQQHSTHDIRTRFAVITDSAADIADEDMERLDIHMVPVRVQFGDRGYLDKVSITTEEFFRELDTNPIHPTSSQPPPGDFRRQYQFLASHFPDVISVNLSSAVSGTFQAAESAAARTAAPGRIHVVDSFNASVGQGLLAVFAAECGLAGLDARTTVAALEAMAQVTWSFALVGDLDCAVRGGRVPRSGKLLADLLRATPVLRNEPDGRIRTHGLLLGKRRRLARFARFVAARLRRRRPLRLVIGHAVCEDDARALATLLATELGEILSTRITGIGSALGVHGGRGTLVVGVQEYREPAEFRPR